MRQQLQARTRFMLMLLAMYSIPASLHAQSPITYNGANAQSGSTGNHIVSSGTTFLKVEAWGGGGGGVSQPNNKGGGGGAYATAIFSVSANQSIPYTVGGGGAIAADGSASVFGSQVSAAGGKKGAQGSGDGIGGAASSCIPTAGAFSGGNGGLWSISINGGIANYRGGGGGGSALATANGSNGSSTYTTAANGGTGTGNGGNGSWSAGDTSINGYNATAGSVPGGGGGGAAGQIFSAGNGASGRIVVYECKQPSYGGQPVGGSVCQNGTFTLTATVNDAAQYQWFSNTANSTAGASPIQGATNASYNPPTNTVGSKYYFVLAANICNTGIAPSSIVQVTVTALPQAPVVPATQGFASGATVANLSAFDNQNNLLTAAQVKWYNINAGGTTLASSTPLVNGNTYYASRISNGCESATRTATLVQICATPTAPILSVLQGTNALIAAFDDSDPAIYLLQGGAQGYAPVQAPDTTNLSSVLYSAVSDTSPVYIRGIVPGTYDFYLSKFCPAINTFGSLSAVATFTVPACTPLSLPWSESFETMADRGYNILPTCWTQSIEQRTGGAEITPYHDPRTGNTYLMNNGTQDTKTAFTPGFALQAGIAYNFSFYFAADGGSGWTGKVLSNTTQNLSGATQLGNPFLNSVDVSDTAYNQIVRSFTPVTSGTYYFAVQTEHATDDSLHFLGMDDFALNPSCSGFAEVTITASATTACAGTPVTFTATLGPTTGASATVQWYKNNDLYPHATMTYTPATLNDTDVIRAVVISYEPDMCSDRDTSNAISIAFTPAVPVTATLTATPVCTRTPVVLTIAGSNLGTAATYGWYKNGNLLPSQTSSTLIIDSVFTGATDTYFGFAAGINTPCASDTFVYTNAVTLIGVAGPTATIRPTGAGIICSGAPLVLRLSGPDTVAGSTFQWYLNNNPIPGATVNNYGATLAGVYKAVVTNAAGCSKASLNRTLTTAESPEISIATSSPYICPNSTVMINASVYTSGSSFRWYRNGVAFTNNSPTFETNMGGTYAIAATVGSCTTISDSVVIQKLFTTPTGMSLTGPATSCEGSETVLLSVASGPLYTYQWYRGVDTIFGATSSTYAPTSTGVYRARIQNATCPAVITTNRVISIKPKPVATIQTLSSNATQAVLRGNNGPSLYDYRWFLNGSALSGATLRDYTATASGNYTLELTNKSSGCKDTSDVKVVVLSSSSARSTGMEIPDAISIYPNPSDGIINISAKQPVNIIIKDAQGRVVMDVRNAAQVDLSNYSSGMYLLLISDVQGNLLQTERVMKR